MESESPRLSQNVAAVFASQGLRVMQIGCDPEKQIRQFYCVTEKKGRDSS